jgi:hypothetical protein
MSAIDPTNAGAARRGNMATKAERDLRTAIINRAD